MFKRPDFIPDEYPWLEEYDCYECGAKMELFDDVLVCPECGHSVKLEDWVTEPDDYELYYPTREEIIGHGDEDDEDYTGEYYDPEIHE